MDAFAREYNLDKYEQEVVFVYHPEEEIDEFLVYYPQKHDAVGANSVKEYVALVPKEQVSFVHAFHPNAVLHIAKNQKEIVATYFDDNKEKYLEVEVLLKDDKFKIFAKDGGWASFERTKKTLGEKKVSGSVESKNIQNQAIKTNDLPIGRSISKFNKTTRFAENLTLKTPSIRQQKDNTELER